MNSKGGTNEIVAALVGLFIALITFYTVMVVWQPITSEALYPLLLNAEAFPYGNTAITLFNVLVLVAVAMIFLAFFNEARGERSPPPGYYGRY